MALPYQFGRLSVTYDMALNPYLRVYGWQKYNPFFCTYLLLGELPWADCFLAVQSLGLFEAPSTICLTSIQLRYVFSLLIIRCALSQLVSDASFNLQVTVFLTPIAIFAFRSWVFAINFGISCWLCTICNSSWSFSSFWWVINYSYRIATFSMCVTHMANQSISFRLVFVSWLWASNVFLEFLESFHSLSFLNSFWVELILSMP